MGHWRKKQYLQQYSLQIEKFRLKPSTAIGMFVHVSLFLPPKKWQTNEREYSIRSDRIEIDWSFVVPGTWYVSPSLISMDERRQHRKTHMDAYRSEQAQTKRCTTCTELWQLIKAHAPNVAALNYAEGPIVHFCLLLLQIIDRFKDVVGGGSCGLLFLFCLLYLPFSTCVMDWLLEHI